MPLPLQRKFHFFSGRFLSSGVWWLFLKNIHGHFDMVMGWGAPQVVVMTSSFWQVAIFENLIGISNMHVWYTVRNYIERTTIWDHNERHWVRFDKNMAILNDDVIICQNLSCVKKCWHQQKLWRMTPAFDVKIKFRCWLSFVWSFLLRARIFRILDRGAYMPPCGLCWWNTPCG